MTSSMEGIPYFLFLYSKGINILGAADRYETYEV